MTYPHSRLRVTSMVSWPEKGPPVSPRLQARINETLAYLPQMVARPVLPKGITPSEVEARVMERLIDRFGRVGYVAARKDVLMMVRISDDFAHNRVFELCNMDEERMTNQQWLRYRDLQAQPYIPDGSQGPNDHSHQTATGGRAASIH